MVYVYNKCYVNLQDKEVSALAKEINPQDSERDLAFKLWINAPNPMVTLFKTFDVTNLVRTSKKNQYKFNMLLDYCIGKAAVKIDEFFILPVDQKLFQYDTIAVNTIVKNKNNGINSCDILFNSDLKSFNHDYLNYTRQCAENCNDRDLSENSMIIGTSAITETTINGAVGMYSGIYNNPFLIWGRYRKKLFRYYLNVSFQFHHTQMDGAHAARFLDELQREIGQLR